MAMDHIVVVVAHPDDAELLFGGIIHNSAKNGQAVSVIVATDGTKWSRIPFGGKKELNEVRKKEARAAAQVLGIKEVVFLDMEDGLLTQGQLFPVLFETLRRLQPTYILTHCQHEGHPDHVVVSQTVQRICNIKGEPMPLTSEFWDAYSKPAKCIKGLFVTWTENISKTAVFVHLNAQDIERQAKALACHKSQFPDKTPESFYKKEHVLCSYYGMMCGIDLAMPLERLNMNNIEVIESL